MLGSVSPGFRSRRDWAAETMPDQLTSIICPYYRVKSCFIFKWLAVDSLCSSLFLPVDFLLICRASQNHSQCIWHQVHDDEFPGLLSKRAAVCFPPSERMCPLPRVALQLLEASLWPASAPHWAPCRLPTCTSMPWSLSTTRFPHQRSTTGLRARLRCCRPRPARWPATTWVAWGASLSWFLPRRGTVQSSSGSSSRERTVQREDGTEGSGTKAGMDALAWFLALYYLHMGIFSAYGDPALLWCWEENLSCAQQSKWSFYQMQKHTKKLLWILSPGRKVSVGIKQTGKVNIYCIYACFFV